MRLSLLTIVLVASSARGDDLSLVRQLGDVSFTVREQAYQKLLLRAAAAKPALEIGVSVDDPEVRIRCRELLARVINSQFDARMKAFLDGQTDLPGWQRYREAIAGAERSRFLELHRAQKELLEALERDVKEGRQKLLVEIEETRERFVQSPKDWQVAELSAILLAIGDPRIRLETGEIANVLSAIETVTLWKDIRTRLSNDPVARTLFIDFSGKLQDPALLNQVLTLLLRLEFREALPLARRVLANPTVGPGARAAALFFVGKVGSNDDLPAVTACLDDTGVIGQRPFRSTPLTAQVRDVALAMAWHLVGENPANHGFPYPRALPSPIFTYAPTCFGFANASDRDAAHEMWKKR